MSTKQDGDWGEALVAEYLEARGCRIVEKEWRCRFGEIDLIAEQEGTLLFVEVKLRTNLSMHGLDAPARFDVAEVYTDVHHSARSTRIEYIENAF